MQDQIIETIKRSLPGAEVHAASPDGVHFQALVISDDFEGMPLVKQHQSVMNALKGEFDSERLHALQLKTFTPAKWERERSRYNIVE